MAWDLPAAQAYYRDIKRRVKAAGRSAPVPILPGLVPYVAAAVEEAHAKQRELDGLVPVAASLRQLGLFTAQDCMTWELDAPVPPLPSLEAFPEPKGRYSTILRIIETEHPVVYQELAVHAPALKTGGSVPLTGTCSEWITSGALLDYGRVSDVYFGLATLHDLGGVTAGAKHRNEYHVALLLKKASTWHV